MCGSPMSGAVPTSEGRVGQYPDSKHYFTLECINAVRTILYHMSLTQTQVRVCD